MAYSSRHACLRAAAGVVALAGLAALPLSVAAPAAGAATATATAMARPAVTALGAGAFPALGRLRPAAGNVSYYLDSGPAAVRAGGRGWELSVQASKSNRSVPGQALIQIETPYLSGDEAHDWTFGDLPTADMRVSKSGGVSVSSGRSLSPVASMTLAFKPSGHKVASCAGGGRQTTYSGRLTGTVKLATGLHKLTVSATRVTFGQPSTLTVSTDYCAPVACQFASWQAASATAVQPPYTLAVGGGTGLPGHLSYYAEVEHVTTLSKAKRIMRGDGAFIKTAAPAFSASGKTLSVKTTSSGAVTGSAVIGPATGGEPQKVTCTAGGKSYTETEATWVGKYASPAGHQLEAHTRLTGTEEIGRTGQAEFVVVTSLKKK